MQVTFSREFPKIRKTAGKHFIFVSQRILIKNFIKELNQFLLKLKREKLINFNSISIDYLNRTNIHNNMIDSGSRVWHN